MTIAIAYPVRYENGQIQLVETDLSSDGFGGTWVHQRSYCNQLSANEDVGQGFNWLVFNCPYLVDDAGTIIVVRSTTSSLWFDPSGGGYVTRHGEKATLSHDTTNHRFVLTLQDGTQQLYYDFSNPLVPAGKFLRQTAPGGAVTEVTSFTDDDQIAEIQRSGTVGGQPLTEVFAYTYTDQRITDVTLRRQLGTSGWEDVRRALYEYYDGTDSFGSEGDLKRVLRQVPVASGWEDSEIFYYRYYVDGELDGFIHGLKFVVQPETYNRMLSASVDPLTATNGTLVTYADKYFEYDNDQRVTLERIEGGSRTFELEYTDGTASTDYNVWKTRTVVTQPDGTQEIAYTNTLGQAIVFEFTDGTQRWISASHYDADAHIVWFANPSAVIGYDDSSPTLDIELRSNDGLIEVTDYYATTGSGAAKGYVSVRKLKKGSSGTPVLQESREYTSQTAGGATVFLVSKQTAYRNDNGTGAIETTNAYTYYSGTTQVQQQATTLPVVPTNQNGSGVAATRKSYFDVDGRLTWSMDERGYITRRLYDLGTGAIVRQIEDVDTSLYMDVPSGWSTPGDGGKNLVTDYISDDQGRTTQVLGPIHTIDIGGTATAIRRAEWVVYDDVNHTTYSGRGYQTGTSPDFGYVLINPVTITKQDALGKALEQIQAASAETDGTLAEIITDAGSGSAAFPQSSYSRWTTTQYADCCLMVSQRAYHTIPTSGIGTEGINYDQARYGYDVMRRRNRATTPGGTITREVYDSRGLVVSVWGGTNDEGATGDDPTGSAVDSDNNMVVVVSNVYDTGLEGGDGNLTKRTQHVDGSQVRITTFLYDWRNRLVDVDGELDFYQRSVYDNLNRVVEARRFDTSPSGNLTGRKETQYDDRGRVFRSTQYGIDPFTGTTGNALVEDSWFDATGNAIKVLQPGSKLFIKTKYDSLGRSLTQYLGYDLDETSYEDVGNVLDDIILEQIEAIYDNASNIIEAISRQRYHDATASFLGPLNDPSTAPKARVSYAVTYPDALGRPQATADYGTNAGTVLTRSGTIPSPTDDILVNFATYDQAGGTLSTTDPSGKVTRIGYDARGRTIELIQNYQASALSSGEDEEECSASDDVNVTVQTTYNADGNIATLTAINAETGSQVTTYVYGTTLADSSIASSTLKRTEVYADSIGSSDVTTFHYNRMGEIIMRADQAGTVRACEYDLLGRMVEDRVTALGSGVDGTARRIATTYEVRGLRKVVTTYDNPTVGTGAVLNEVLFEYNDFGQLIEEYQSHGGPVNASTTPKVQYRYVDGSGNTIRLTGMIYPDGRELTYSYGTTGSMADAASRVLAIIDDNDTHLVDYEYLGHATFVVADGTQPQVKWTLIDLTGTDDPDTGDIYSGLDRFGRVKDNRWYNYNAEEDVDRLQYGYDRASNRLWRSNLVAQSLSKEFDELYDYDGIHRLKSMGRGLLDSIQTALTSQTFAQCWTLDSTGNWSSMKQADAGGSWTLDQARTVNGVNEITDITNTVGSAWSEPAYDAAGNMTTMPQPSSPTLAFGATYDAWNRHVKTEDGDDAVNQCAYDGLHRRIVRSVFTDGVLDTCSHNYFSNVWQVIEERLNDSSTPRQQLIWGLRWVDNLVLRDRDTNNNGELDEKFYCTQDANWNVTAIFSSDAAIEARFAYSSYGSPLWLTPTFGDSATNAYDWEILLHGAMFDVHTSMYDVRNRNWNPLLGVWTSRDIVTAGLAFKNAYEFCSSNPLVFVDPDGWQPISDYIYQPPSGPSHPQIPSPFGGNLPDAFFDKFKPDKEGCYEMLFSDLAAVLGSKGISQRQKAVIWDAGCVGLTAIGITCDRDNFFPHTAPDGSTAPNIPFPDRYPSVQCYAGDGAETTASNRACAEGERNAVFSKQGQWMGAPPPDGPVDPRKVRGIPTGDPRVLDIYYITKVGKYYWWLDNKRYDKYDRPLSPDVFIDKWVPPAESKTYPQNIKICPFPRTDEDYPARIWCSVCVPCP